MPTRSIGPPEAGTAPIPFDSAPFWEFVARSLGTILSQMGKDAPDRLRDSVQLLVEEMSLVETNRQVPANLQRTLQGIAERGASLERALPATHLDRNAVFWAYARRFMASRIRYEPDTRDDLGQLALLQLERHFGRMQQRHEELVNPEALMTRIASATQAEYQRGIFRTKTLHQRLGEPEAATDSEFSLDEVPPGDPYETRWWAVREYLKTRYRGPSCGEICDKLLEGKTHKDIAVAYSVSHESVRQRWSRCCEEVRRLFSENRHE